MYKSTILVIFIMTIFTGCVEKTPTPITQKDIIPLETKIKDLSGDNGMRLKVSANHDIYIGEILDFKATSSTNGYLKVILIEPNGARSVIIPNQYGRQNYLRANIPFYSKNSQSQIRITPPKGKHFLIVIFTEKNAPLQINQGMQRLSDALHSDQDLINLLKAVKNRVYGASHITILPINVKE